MIEDQYLTIAGTAAADPELRFTPSGAAVCNFSLAVNHRRYNKQSGQWEEAGTDWWRVNAWRQLSENAAESIKRGDRVLVYGKVASRTYETREGVKVTVWEITAEEIGHSMKFAPTAQRRATRGGEQAQQGQRGDQGQQGGQYSNPNRSADGSSGSDGRPPQNDDPWSQPSRPPANQGAFGSENFQDEPPF